MKNKSRNERLESMSDALFGSPENMDLTEAVESLQDAGIDPEELCNRMYERLCIAARAYRMRQEEVPPLLRKALNDLRPSLAPARTPEELDRRADSVISRIVSATKAPLSLPSDLSGLTLNPSFRKKKSEESARDQRIIDSLEEELLADLEKEEKKDQD
jgi:hypothetical protein